jgi:hypothetical protein
MQILTLTIGLQTIVASSNTVVTSLDPIHSFACFLSVRGMWATFFVGLAELCLVAYVSPCWIRTDVARLSPVGLWALSLFTFNLVVFLTHLRSALVCTV